jgi:putative Holliday junction resolvase
MQPPTILALDVGSKRIGVAIADRELRFAKPLTTLANDNDFWRQLEDIILAQNVAQLVVGLPRGLEGQETAQTRAVLQFIEQLQQHVQIPLATQDEALTSVKAEEELVARGKPFGKGEVDALAATYILEDYVQSQGIAQ